ncbi:KH domain-containing protein [Selenomonas artemidis]|uniref:KH domain-containing protein n=1 Tax=Selenomonas artemidis TaxID=671224 RepID=UPI0003F70A64|nr:KH domain-containing protein [Selenomonas artemidis]
MKEIVEVIAKSLVDHSEAVVVDETQDDQEIILKLHVAEDDMGKVIGKQGRIAKALRSVVKAAATKENKRATVEIG